MPILDPWSLDKLPEKDFLQLDTETCVLVIRWSFWRVESLAGDCLKAGVFWGSQGGGIV